jgi:hypothetical protein
MFADILGSIGWGLNFTVCGLTWSLVESPAVGENEASFSQDFLRQEIHLLGRPDQNFL